MIGAIIVCYFCFCLLICIFCAWYQLQIFSSRYTVELCANYHLWWLLVRVFCLYITSKFYFPGWFVIIDFHWEISSIAVFREEETLTLFCFIWQLSCPIYYSKLFLATKLFFTFDEWVAHFTLEENAYHEANVIRFFKKKLLSCDAH